MTSFLVKAGRPKQATKPEEHAAIAETSVPVVHKTDEACETHILQDVEYRQRHQHQA